MANKKQTGKEEQRAVASRINGLKGGRPPEWWRKARQRLKKNFGWDDQTIIVVGDIVLGEWKQTKEGLNHVRENII